MSRQSDTLQLACELISRPSVTPADAGCQELLIDRLQAPGFEAEKLRFGDVEAADLKASLQEVAGHGLPHGSEPDEPDHLNF